LSPEESSPQHPREALTLAFFLGAAGGAILFLSDHPVGAWFAQLLAFVPFISALGRYDARHWTGIVAGTAFGLAYTIPMVVMLGFPVLVSVLQVLYHTIWWTLAGLMGARVLRHSGHMGAIGFAALVTGLQWLDTLLWSTFGTAQLFTRVWSAVPDAIQFISITGPTGLVFVVVAFQALVVRGLIEPTGNQVRTMLTLLGLLALIVWWDNASVGQGHINKLRVAVGGWLMDKGSALDPDRAIEIIQSLHEPLVDGALANGAKVVVLPEASVALDNDNRDEVLAHLGALVAGEDVILIVGFLDLDRNLNQAVIVRGADDGRVLYTKTHLVPTLESWNVGDGRPVRVTYHTTPIGVMICQDDNFPDVARGHGQRLTQVMAVPTNDWSEVKVYHAENSILRTIEHGYALARAARNGISLIADPWGRVLGRRDHFKEGAGMVLADLPVGPGGSIFTRLGNWLPVTSIILALAMLLFLPKTRP
jgi:apolipoprotein N-acyltransferase